MWIQKPKMNEGAVPLSRLETELEQAESKLSQLEPNLEQADSELNGLESGQPQAASPHDASLEEAKKKYLADLKAASRKEFRLAMLKVSPVHQA